MATAGHIASPVRKQRKMNMNTAAQPPLFLFSLSRTITPRMVLPTFKKRLLSY